jgi:hypothetical protein
MDRSEDEPHVLVEAVSTKGVVLALLKYLRSQTRLLNDRRLVD